MVAGKLLRELPRDTNRWKVEQLAEGNAKKGTQRIEPEVMRTITVTRM